MNGLSFWAGPKISGRISAMCDNWPIRPITPDEWPDYCRKVDLGFGTAIADDEIARAERGFEYERSLAAFDDGRLVGTAAAFSTTLSVPGRLLVPAAGIDRVTVSSTHRRRGILRSMMARQLHDIQERGESLAVLNASESLIYGRFGYGRATEYAAYAISTAESAFQNPVLDSHTVELVGFAEAADLLPGIHADAQVHTPGAIAHSPEWRRRFLETPVAERTGEKSKFIAVARDASLKYDGYAIYRMDMQFDEGMSTSALHLDHLVTADERARIALWRFLLDVDLVRTVSTRNSPVDEILLWLLADPRQLRTRYRADGLWLRILDVPAALSARLYALEGTLVFEVHDRFRPATAGRFYLEASSSGASCRRTGLEPDIVLQIADLGAAYLGGVPFSLLARAQRIREETAGALRRADAMFSSSPLPWCMTQF
jgi:predicted acetyltransferase